jgi:mannose-6-phosphate isomerase class I
MRHRSHRSTTLRNNLCTEIVELMATSDNVMNLAFVPPSEKDDVNIFVDAVTCEPKPGEAYKIQRSKWAKSSGSGATVYKVSQGLPVFYNAVLADRPPSCHSIKVPTEEFSIYHVQQEGPVIIGGLSGPSVAIITATPTSGGKLTPRGEDPIDVERGMVFFIGAGTEVEYSGGVDAWAAFFDDEAQEQTGSMK